MTKAEQGLGAVWGGTLRRRRQASRSMMETRSELERFEQQQRQQRQRQPSQEGQGVSGGAKAAAGTKHKGTSLLPSAVVAAEAATVEAAAGGVGGLWRAMVPRSNGEQAAFELILRPDARGRLSGVGRQRRQSDGKLWLCKVLSGKAAEGRLRLRLGFGANDSESWEGTAASDAGDELTSGSREGDLARVDRFRLIARRSGWHSSSFWLERQPVLPAPAEADD